MDDAGKGSTAATVCTAVLAVATLGLIGVCAAVIFHFSPNGTGYVIGEWLGAFLVALLIASLAMRRDLTRPWRVPVALAVALLVLLVSRANDVRASIEDVKAQKILAAVTSLDELDKAVKENPDNALLRVLGAAMAAKRESGRRLQKLLEDYDDKDLQSDFRQADLPTLRRYLAALRKLETQATEREDTLLTIFDDQLKAVRAAASTSLSENRRASFLRGFEGTRGREIETWKQFLAAQDSMVAAHDKQIAFLIDANGRYKWDAPSGKFVFARNDDLQAFNQHATAVGDANSRMQRLQKELQDMARWRQSAF